MNETGRFVHIDWVELFVLQSNQIICVWYKRPVEADTYSPTHVGSSERWQIKKKITTFFSAYK